MKRNIAALIAGVVFGFGLALSQMVNPRKVLAFLDVTGGWDPSLALVMGGALGITALGYRWVLRRNQPVCASQFHLPTRKHLDKGLISGAMVFGAGWGLGGFCPGPAIAALVAGSWEAPVFVLALLAGSLSSKILDRPARDGGD